MKLKSKIIGQNEAVESLAAAIKRSRVQISPRRHPASFIFVGPTGVGKTELVKVLSAELFDSPETLIRLDMSEFMEKHSVSKIIGSPPGYVGYDEAGQVTEKVRRRPYSVLLFDEIEKAHPDVLNILLQILDEGRLTDAHGRVVNFENTVIVMTSNAGSDMKEGILGFNKSENEQSREKAMKALSAPFVGIKFIPTGGVNGENIGEYFSAPFIHAVGGSWVCAKKDIAEGNFEKITELCENVFWELSRKKMVTWI